MKELIISQNDTGRRMDKFLRKLLPGAPLSTIYRIIRKDVKVNSSRVSPSYTLNINDKISLYISDDIFLEFAKNKMSAVSSKSNSLVKPDIIYEDKNILICNKPAGLLTHGTDSEKRNTLANQVVDYLIQTGEYKPCNELTFRPSPVNRLDRNTSGLIIFGKTLEASRELSQLILNKFIDKYYNTIVLGRIVKPLHLSSYLIKDESRNMVKIVNEFVPGSKLIETEVLPLEYYQKLGTPLTFVQIKLITGRSHQIRAALCDAGYPLLGDPKYHTKAGLKDTRKLCESLGINCQLLHAAKIKFHEDIDKLIYLRGHVFTANLPLMYNNIKKELQP